MILIPNRVIVRTLQFFEICNRRQNIVLYYGELDQHAKCVFTVKANHKGVIMDAYRLQIRPHSWPRRLFKGL